MPIRKFLVHFGRFRPHLVNFGYFHVEIRQIRAKFLTWLVDFDPFRSDPVIFLAIYSFICHSSCEFELFTISHQIWSINRITSEDLWSIWTILDHFGVNFRCTFDITDQFIRKYWQISMAYFFLLIIYSHPHRNKDNFLTICDRFAIWFEHASSISIILFKFLLDSSRNGRFLPHFHHSQPFWLE